MSHPASYRDPLVERHNAHAFSPPGAVAPIAPHMLQWHQAATLGNHVADWSSHMSHAIHISDEAYRQLKRVADESEDTPAVIVESLITSMAIGPGGRENHYYSLDNWFRHLGMTEEEIAEIDRAAIEVDEDS